MNIYNMNKYLYAPMIITESSKNESWYFLLDRDKVSNSYILITEIDIFDCLASEYFDTNMHVQGLTPNYSGCVDTTVLIDTNLGKYL